MVSWTPPRRSDTLPPGRLSAGHFRARPTRLHLNAFRGEPAISGFDWHFTPTHRSSLQFAIWMGSGLHVRVPRASPCPWVAHPVSGRPPATCPPFRTRVRSGSGCPCLNLATDGHSSAHSTKGTPSPPPPPACAGAGLRPAGSARVQALFHSPRRGAFHRSLTVLVHYRSPTVFSLGPWSTLLPAAFHVGGGTHDHRPPARTCRRLRDSHPLRSPVPAAFG